MYNIHPLGTIQLYKEVVRFSLSLKISNTTELISIKFSVVEKLDIDPGLVLVYFVIDCSHGIVLDYS